MKQQRITCHDCRERFTYYRLGAGRPPLYCPACIEERKRDQARERMAAMRARSTRPPRGEKGTASTGGDDAPAWP